MWTPIRFAFVKHIPLDTKTEKKEVRYARNPSNNIDTHDQYIYKGQLFREYPYKGGVLRV